MISAVLSGEKVCNLNPNRRLGLV